MPSNADDPPYRSESGTAMVRIAELERELSTLRRSVERPHVPELAALRTTHLREDRQRLIARYRAARRLLFPATGGAMLFVFTCFLMIVRRQQEPHAMLLWLACCVLVTAAAAMGLLLGQALHVFARSRCRRIDRRIAEEQVIAGVAPTHVPTRVLASDDTTLLADPDPLAELEERAVRVAAR